MNLSPTERAHTIMRFTKLAALPLILAAAAVAYGCLTTTPTAIGETQEGVHAVPGVRMANPTPNSPVRVTIATGDNDGMVVEGTVVLRSADWVCIDRKDGDTAWIPTSRILIIEGKRVSIGTAK